MYHIMGYWASHMYLALMLNEGSLLGNENKGNSLIPAGNNYTL